MTVTLGCFSGLRASADEEPYECETMSAIARGRSNRALPSQVDAIEHNPMPPQGFEFVQVKGSGVHDDVGLSEQSRPSAFDLAALVARLEAELAVVSSRTFRVIAMDWAPRSKTLKAHLFVNQTKMPHLAHQLADLTGATIMGIHSSNCEYCDGFSS